MTPITLPQARIPLGWVTLANQRLPVEIDTEWMRALLTLLNRVGVVSGVDFTSVIEELAAVPLAPEPLAPADWIDVSAAHVEPAKDPSGRLEALEALVQQLQGQINDMQQGYQV